jgi:hypothetical protein
MYMCIYHTDRHIKCQNWQTVALVLEVQSFMHPAEKFRSSIDASDLYS